MTSSHPNVDFIQSRVPSWVARLKRKELAALLPDSATAREPQWLRRASAPMRKELLANQARSHASRHEAAKAFVALQSAYEFCLPKIEAMLRRRTLPDSTRLRRNGKRSWANGGHAWKP